MTARAPRPLSPAQREVLALARDRRVFHALDDTMRWYAGDPWPGVNRTVTRTVETLIRARLLKTGPFVALGTPRLAVLTDTGRRMLEQITADRREAS